MSFSLSLSFQASGTEAELVYLKANTHFNNAQYSQAIEQYNLFLSKFPAHSKRIDVQYGLGISCFLLKKYQDAASALTIAVADKKCPDIARANYFLGQSLLLIGKYAESEKALDEGLKALLQIQIEPKNKALHTELERTLKTSRLDALIHQKKWAEVVKQSDDLKVNAGEEAKRASFYGALARFELKKYKEVVDVLKALAPDVKGTHHQQQTHFILAESYRELGEMSEAMVEYEGVIKSSGPFVNQALYRMGILHYQQGNSDKAIHFLSKFCLGKDVSVDIKKIESAEIHLGVLYIQLKNSGAARVLLNNIWNKETHSFRPEAGYYLAGIISKEKNSLLKAANIFGEVSDHYPKHQLAADARLQQGTILSSSGNFIEAQKSYEKFAIGYPNHKDIDKINYQLGLCLMEQQQWHDALVYFKKVPQKSSWSDEALYQSAWCLKKKADKPASVKHYKELLLNHPESPWIDYATIELAELDFEAGELEKSAKRLEKLVDKGIDTELKTRAQYRLGWCYFQTKDYQKAARLYELVSSSQVPDLLMSALWQAGESRLRAEEYVAASTHFKKMTQAAKPADKNLIELQEQSWLRLGNAQALAKRWAESSKAFASFIERYPKHPQSRLAYVGMGIALREQKLHDEAIVAFSGVLKGEKRDELGAKAQYLLGECYLAQKRYDQAVAEYMKVALFPFKEWQSRALYESAVAFERKGDRNRAHKQFKELIMKYPRTEAAKLAEKRDE
tara:strand:- start:915 stop:3122 length:2208 start_codon:yes stop_codon:yes gene_type:complete